MSSAPVVFDRLTHWFGERCVLDHVSLAVPRGSVFALLGRNGAGKTTALRCLLGMLAPTGGAARLLGHEAHLASHDVLSRVAFVSEGHGLPAGMSLRALIAFQAAAFPHYDEAACRSRFERLGLPLSTRPRKLSRGQRAQVALALALAANPELVVLDDPALGLDAVVRREYLETVIDLIQEEGRTVLLTSHILGDVERVADHVAILDNGVLRVCAPLDELRRRVVRLHAFFEDAPPAALTAPGIVRTVRRRNELLLTVAGDVEAAAASARAHGATLVEHETLGLEDLFIDYTGGAS